MIKYVAFLRGINVGGHRKILMADLKLMFIKMGLTNPITYIQSGNIVFESTLTDVNELEKSITKSIKDTFNFDVPVIIRTASEMKSVVVNSPFFSPDEDIKSFHIVFLSDKPNRNNVDELKQVDFGNDQFKIIGQEVHLFVEVPYHKSKLTNKIIESKLNCSSTTRNWKTVNKLVEMTK